MKIWVAKESDTLRSIAQQCEVDVYDLLFINPHITNPDMIIQGMIINISEPLASPQASVTPLPVPVCPIAQPVRLLDQWVPLTPLSEMEQAEYDILIIGTGMGGTAALWRLCEQLGKSSIRIGIIDRGGLLLPTNALNTPTLSDWNNMMEYYLSPAITEPIGDLLPEYSGLRMVYALGGRTLFWAGTTPRIPPFEFANWPITYKEIEPYYNLAEQAMQVNRYSSPYNQLLLGRLWQGGYPESSLLPEAVDYNGFSVHFNSLNFLAEALRLGSLDLAVNARAVRILTNGRSVTGVKVMSPDKTSYLLRAKTVIVAGSAFETPRLLLSSEIPGRAIGHYLINHSYMKSQGTLKPEDTAEGMVSLLIPQAENRPYQFKIGGTKTYLEFDVSGSIVPRFDNYVYLDPSRTDDYGIPSFQVNFSYNEVDKTVMVQMVQAIRQVASIMKMNLTPAAGRPEICLWPPGAENHDAGTCRLGDDPATSATDRNGQIHGISGLYVADNSLIPSLGPVNPSLTTAALAIRTADHILKQLNAAE
jgi:Choline dehydrogenase and related flavoproteins